MAFDLEYVISIANPVSFRAFDASVANVYGVLLTGTLLSNVLYGIGCLQTYIYFKCKPENDPLALKVLVIWLFLTVTVHQVGLSCTIYKVTVQEFGNKTVLQDIPQEITSATLSQGLLTFGAQLFFIHRIWKFSESVFSNRRTFELLIFPVICTILAVVQLVLVFVVNGLATRYSLGEVKFFNTTIWIAMTYTIHGINLFLELLFVIVMPYLLLREGRSLAPNDMTRRVIHRLVLLVINTGFVTLLSSVLAIVFLAIFPKTFIYGFFFFLVGPLYCNTVLANLNSRNYIRGGKNLEFVYNDSAYRSVNVPIPPQSPIQSRSST